MACDMEKKVAWKEKRKKEYFIGIFYLLEIMTNSYTAEPNSHSDVERTEWLRD